MAKILVADDNKAGLYTMEKILTVAGHTVVPAINGTQAYETFKEEMPDLVVTDIRMPGMDGFELAQKIRSINDASHVPIIFISAAYADISSKIKALEIGGNDYLIQPVDHHELIARISARLREKNLFDELFSTKEALKVSEDLFRTIFQLIPDAVNINRLDGSHFVKVNKGFIDLIGYSKDEIIGRTALELNIWHNLKERERFFSELFSRGMVKNFEAKFKCKNGRYITATVSARTLIYQDHPHLLAVTRDISDVKKAERAIKKAHRSLEKKVEIRTSELRIINEELHKQINERKLVEQALKESESNYATLVEASMIGVHISINGKIHFLNDQFAEIYGYEKDEMLGMKTIELIHPEERETAEQNRKKRLAGEGPGEYETKGVRKNGEVVWLLRRNNIIEYKGKSAVLGNVTDITVRKKTEEALKESEKELRVLSARLLSAEERERKRISNDIHDGIGQALSAIKFSVENALRYFNENNADSSVKALHDVVPFIQQSIEDVRRIVMDLRPSTLDDLGVTATISWFCREFESIHSSIKVEQEVTIDEDEVPVRLKTVIYRVLQEAMNNAAKYSKAKSIQLSLIKKDSRVYLKIKDHGKGFNLDKVLLRKSTRRGIGLASMRERTELSGGEYLIEAVQKKGTTIKCSWPVRKYKRPIGK